MAWAESERLYDLRSKMREAAKVLEDDLGAYDTEVGATNRYRSVLRDKRHHLSSAMYGVMSKNSIYLI